MKIFFKKPLVIALILVIIVVIAVGIYYFFVKNKTSPYEIITVQRGDISQIVSVTGKVKPAENVDLAFERSGKIASIGANVGDRVIAGQLLATIDNADLTAQISQAKASLAAQQAKLDEIKRGTRAEELQIAQTSLANAQKTLEDAKINLTNVKSTAEASLRQLYDGALNAASKSTVTAINSIYVLTDMQFAHFLSSSQNDTTIAEAKSKAIAVLLGGTNTGLWTNNFISQLSGGTKAAISMAQQSPTYANIDNVLNQTAISLDLVGLALETIPLTEDLTSTERTNISTEKSNINTEITTIGGKQQSIKVQQATNNYNIMTAEISVTTAQNTLASAQDQLNLKLAGSAPEQITAQEAQVKSAQANVEVLEAQLAKTIMRSPINGIITRQEAKVGQIVAANAVQISLLSSAKFEIEANISENEIAKINLGDTAQMTLDALGSTEKFSGKIIKIDPAETIVSGVIYYKITCVFDSEDERIKSGMTVNLDIQTDKKENVLYLPYYTVKSRNGDKYVQILDNGQLKEKTIKTGLEGETMIEITQGLTEGETVVMSK